MSTDGMSAARRTLVAYSEQRATADAVMRALVSHDGWFVPAGLAHGFTPDDTFERVIIFSERFDSAPAQLAIFTDHESAMRADGHPIGVYVGPVEGAKVFAALDAGAETLRVNPASPQSEQWFIGREAFPYAAIWARAISIERALLADETPPELFASVREFPGFMIVVSAGEPSPVYWPQFRGVRGRFAAIFTTPDRAQAWVGRLPEDQRAGVTVATLAGADLFRQLQAFGADGVLVNVDDPQTTAMIPKALFGRVVGG